MSRTHRTRVIGSTSLALSLLLATGCGTSGPGSGETMQVWALEDAAVNEIVEQGIEAHNGSHETPAELVTFVNDAYKQRLQVALGSPNAPDVFFNWGGGNLAQYTSQGRVHDLTRTMEDNPGFRDSFLPSVLDVAAVDGSYYGVPLLGVQPVVMYYNRDVLDGAGLEPPRTIDDLYEAIDVLREEGVTPITLPGAQGWTQLMWFSYLVDRVGGPDVFQAISDGEEGAWEHPAVLEAMEMCQDLVERGAFGNNFSSIDYDNGSASALLATGESAMFLMGSWDLAQQMENNPEFVESGALGFTSFPALEGGAGEPGAIVGNPSNYFSVNSDSEHTEAAVDFLVETMASDEYVDELIAAGQVPAVEGIEDRLQESDHAEFATFTHELVSEAPTFTQSWDQALAPDAAEAMLTNLQLLFLGDLTPEEFAQDMESLR
ncbi:raffinose/stachyose/melibiose transport system substrate-binding protein/xylobiose transport system substrate-binding protein [Nocardiopsis terrae]|uniref:Raffinose/stachyose/melibiose transport system substrate-binding protein/xylobiose transport system substrate-binding protein n=1 Tax=Nocardiopsis terrae TaxID=372655 RepID=A0ABR9HEE5_9ACTN|nr:extracellular solute-binding protein [Nocardiopsis terrae]MBE1457170.1 raffinose/stachyose/melibiose transport system substrate-binding protein/xylobiose transport system substrate-binding protein [Nocardiopsis terrae]